MVSSRTRKARLEEDSKLLNELVKESPYISILEKSGNPPTKYVIEFTCRGIKLASDSKIEYSEYHKVEIILGPNYPLKKPQIRFITQQIYHPNVSSTGNVCIGNEWIPSARFLDDLVVFCAQMIRYEGFNLTFTDDAYNKAAYEWAMENLHLLPVDKRPLVTPTGIYIKQKKILKQGNPESSVSHVKVIKKK